VLIEILLSLQCHSAERVDLLSAGSGVAQGRDVKYETNVIAFPDGAITARVEPGIYKALYRGHKCMVIFRQKKLRVTLQLLEHPGISVFRWYQLVSYGGGRIAVNPGSSAVRELQNALGRKVRYDQLPVSLLTGETLTIRIKDVTLDRKQRALTPINVYSVCEEIL
jgi:hypothetical protein